MRSLIYPAPDEPVPPAPPPYVDVALEGLAGSALSAWFARSPDGTAPAILFLHGNGENLGTLVGSPFLDDLCRLSAHVLIVDYPGYGKSAGAPNERSVVAAARAALRWLKQSAPDSPLFVIGWSLGAAVATQAVAQDQRDSSELAGLVLISPWSSLLDVAAVHAPRILARLVLRDRYETERDVASIPAPTLVIHGRYDSLIPVAQGRRVAAAAKNLSALVIPKDGQHNDVLDQPEARSALAAFIREHSQRA